MQIGSGLTLLLGGVRSGKSDLAVRLGQAWDERSSKAVPSDSTEPPVLFVATAEALDADMEARIDRHQRERSDRWPTIEQPFFGAEHVAGLPTGPLIILDCLTLLTSNLMLDGDRDIADHVEALGAALAARSGPSIVVSNEVGMGIHPETELGRRYRDELGRANRIVAEAATTALFIVAGRALPLEPVTWDEATDPFDKTTLSRQPINRQQ